MAKGALCVFAVPTVARKGCRELLLLSASITAAAMCEQEVLEVEVEVEVCTPHSSLPLTLS